jgi:hypothetical protein
LLKIQNLRLLADIIFHYSKQYTTNTTYVSFPELMGNK